MTDDTALTVIEPEEGRVTRLGAARPESTIELATSMANALADIVEKKNLYVTIGKGDYAKRYPTVEAWATIARMDNVVAREAEPPIRHEDGSYEAFVELIRLSDGMVIGRASALCGMEDDEPWGGTKATQWKPAKPPRAEYARRSMAVTRATSRAFRQHYSWIMALAGYEATPAEEMPQDSKDVTPRRDVGFVSDTPHGDTTHDGGLIGIAAVGKAKTSDWEIRKEGDDDHFVLGFKLTNGRKSYNVLTRDELALQLADAKATTVGQRVTVWGRVVDESFEKNGRTITYQVVHAERVQTSLGLLPVSPLREESSTPAGFVADSIEKALRDPEDVLVAPGQGAFDLVESARIDAEEAKAAG